MNKWVAVVVLDLMVLTAAVGFKAMTTRSGSAGIIGGPLPTARIIGGPLPTLGIIGGPLPTAR